MHICSAAEPIDVLGLEVVTFQTLKNNIIYNNIYNLGLCSEKLQNACL